MQVPPLCMMTNVMGTKSISTNTAFPMVMLLTSKGVHPNLKSYLINYIKNRISHMNMWSKCIFLNNCIKKRITTKEIEILAKRMVCEFGAKQRQRKEEVRIIRYRLSEKENQITDSKNIIAKDIRKAQKFIQFSDSLWEQFNQIRKAELNPRWEELRKRRN